MKRIAIYIRVSTQEQAKEGYSIGAQKDKLLAYCHLKNWSVYDIFEDDGYTGSNMNRPALKRLLEELSNIDGVLVYKLDRLSRSQKDVLYLVEENFLQNNVDFISILESFDTTTAFGKAMIGILAVFAQLERETIIERTKLGKEKRAKEGAWRGGPLPLGYSYIDEELEVNSYEADIVKKIFSMYIAGNGMNTIAKNLNREGYKSKQGKSFSPSKIKTYLANPLYCGMVPYKNEVFNGNHKAIINKNTFNMVQKLIKKRSSTFQKRSESLLGGLLICGSCGAGMFKRKIKSYRYYTCYTYHGSPQHMVTAKKCEIGYINASNLEAQIISNIELLNLDEEIEVIEDIISDILDSINLPSQNNTLEKLKKQLIETDKELKRWYDAYGKGTIDIVEIEKRIKLNTDKKNNIEKKINNLIKEEKCKKKLVTKEEIIAIIKNFHVIWNKSLFLEKKIILQGLIKSITVHKDKPPDIDFRL